MKLKLIGWRTPISRTPLLAAVLVLASSWVPPRALAVGRLDDRFDPRRIAQVIKERLCADAVRIRSIEYSYLRNGFEELATWVGNLSMEGHRTESDDDYDIRFVVRRDGVVYDAVCDMTESFLQWDPPEPSVTIDDCDYSTPSGRVPAGYEVLEVLYLSDPGEIDLSELETGAAILEEPWEGASERRDSGRLEEPGIERSERRSAGVARGD